MNLTSFLIGRRKIFKCLKMNRSVGYKKENRDSSIESRDFDNDQLYVRVLVKF